MYFANLTPRHTNGCGAQATPEDFEVEGAVVIRGHLPAVDAAADRRTARLAEHRVRLIPW